MFEDQPLGKLAALVLRPECFRQHGMEHPLGAQHRGVVDVIPHDLDAELLRGLAPTICFEVLEHQIVMGDAEEITQEVRAYAEQGCEHVMLINTTGLVGGVAEALAQTPRLATLCQSLAAIDVAATPTGRKEHHG